MNNLIKVIRIEKCGQSMLISESIASRILCLPLFVGLEESVLEKIVSLMS